ncbi:TGACG (TGA) motif-binding protein 9 [Hibiscus trionum]|uniref:TGACG (TGA) motif-binding protein 9 n=1 Tax=Hibiscus trionum TaxID=183268 RepID=A0A9W7M683_HIBTR|nr:TGACG (TGA) motif-binding protein 9 [Hibiscus trionum]
MANHHIPCAHLHGNGMNVSTSFIYQQGSAFDFGELEEAIVKASKAPYLSHLIFLTFAKANNSATAPKIERELLLPALKKSSEILLLGFSAALLATGRTAGATLEMFPSWPIRFQQTPIGSSKSGGESTDSGSALNTLEPESSSSSYHQAFDQHQLQQQQQDMASDPSTTLNQTSAAIAKPHQDKKRASTSEKQLDAKTLRRLAQNREAARKSRLRKKAYVQQLESSRMKLTQLEQELQRTRSQGLLLGSSGGAVGNMSSGVAICDMEYARWLEDDERHMSDLRTGLHSNLSDSDLRLIVDAYISHYDEIFRLKGMAAKFDVFHLLTGMWTTPAERCFLWMGGFRPSELIKILIPQLDPLTEQQLMGIYSLQHSSQQAEEALTQGLEQLQQSLIDTVASGPVIDGMQQMAVALSKLANLEGFVRQADNLRQQTLHQLPRILTVRQAARCFLVIGEYYGRLRALSSLWASRPRGRLMGDEQSWQTTEPQMVQPSQSHFSHF